MPVIGIPYRNTGDDPVSPLPDAYRQHAGSPLASKFDRLVEFYGAAIDADHPAISTLERLVNREAARSAAALDMAEDCQISIFRAADQCGTLAGVPSNQVDARLVAAMKSPALTKLAQFQAVQKRGLFDAVRLLDRLKDSTPESLILPEVVRTEVECARYLRSWQEARTWCCPSCSGNTRSWLANRQIHQCRCGGQYSVRYRTIYEKSHVPLLVWFSVVGYAVGFPQVTGGQIARHIAYRRPQTISQLLQRIRQALSAADADQQLADVNTLFASYCVKC